MKEQILYDSTYMRYQAVKSIETESRKGAARNWGGGELQFNRCRDRVLQDEKSSGGGLHNNVNVLNTAGLATSI